MKPKIVITLFALFMLLMMAVYFIVNPSYEKSIKAKYYFEMGEYTEAYSLAQEAFSIDVYNRMAATIMAQSKTSMRYVNYNKEARKYMKQIDEIALHQDISEADKAKIRLICEIMIGSYTKLAPSIITDKELVQESADYYHKFEKLLEKVTRR
jgi:tetratricopeptide (TPR) repeat protein